MLSVIDSSTRKSDRSRESVATAGCGGGADGDEGAAGGVVCAGLVKRGVF